MIIIKTTNGDVFVNEAEMMHVQHLHDTRQVKIEKRTGTTTINDVETITYTTKDTEWKDDGSNLAHLHKLVVQTERQLWHLKTLAEQREDAMREFDRKLWNVNQELECNNMDNVKSILKNYMERRPIIIEHLEQSEKSLEESKVETYRIAQEQIKQDNELERQRQEQRKELEDEIIRIQHDLFDAGDELYRLKNRNLWQRIINK